MSERSCQTCVHARFPKQGRLMLELGHCALAVKHLDAMQAASAALGRAPQVLSGPYVGSIGLHNGGSCAAWEEEARH